MHILLRTRTVRVRSVLTDGIHSISVVHRWLFHAMQSQRKYSFVSCSVTKPWKNAAFSVATSLLKLGFPWNKESSKIICNGDVNLSKANANICRDEICRTWKCRRRQWNPNEKNIRRNDARQQGRDQWPEGIKWQYFYQTQPKPSLQHVVQQRHWVSSQSLQKSSMSNWHMPSGTGPIKSLSSR